MSKETVNRVKSQPRKSEKIFANHVSELISKIYRKLLQFNSKQTKTNNLILKWARDEKRHRRILSSHH